MRWCEINEKAGLLEPIKAAVENLTHGRYHYAEPGGYHSEPTNSRFKKPNSAHHPETYDDMIPYDEAIVHLAERMSRMFARGSAPLYRLVKLTDQQLAALEDGSRIGQFWTDNPEAIEMDALYGGQDMETIDLPTYAFMAYVPVTSVDWEQTLHQNTRIPWEREITVKRGAPVKMFSVQKMRDHYFSKDDPKTILRNFTVGVG